LNSVLRIITVFVDLFYHDRVKVSGERSFGRLLRLGSYKGLRVQSRSLVNCDALFLGLSRPKLSNSRSLHVPSSQSGHPSPDRVSLAPSTPFEGLPAWDPDFLCELASAPLANIVLRVVPAEDRVRILEFLILKNLRAVDLLDLGLVLDLGRVLCQLLEGSQPTLVRIRPNISCSRHDWLPLVRQVELRLFLHGARLAASASSGSPDGLLQMYTTGILGRLFSKSNGVLCSLHHPGSRNGFVILVLDRLGQGPRRDIVSQP